MVRIHSENQLAYTALGHRGYLTHKMKYELFLQPLNKIKVYHE